MNEDMNDRYHLGAGHFMGELPEEISQDLLRSHRRTVTIGWMMAAAVILMILAVIWLHDRGMIDEINVGPRQVAILRVVLLGVAVFELVSLQLVRMVMLRTIGVKQPRQHGQQLFTVSIITFAVSSGIALYGLIMLVLSGRRPDLFPFLGMAAAAMLVYFPRYEQWKRLVEDSLRQGGAGPARG